MIWSKKITIHRELLADCLKNSLAIKTAGYRKAYEDRGRTWIQYCGEELVSFCDFRFEQEWRARRSCTPETEMLSSLARDEIFSKQDFGLALGQYVTQSIDESLVSTNVLIRGLAMLDRRVGKRRLRTLVGRTASTFVEKMLSLRLQAEEGENERRINV